jgi:hypothetical protein
VVPPTVQDPAAEQRASLGKKAAQAELALFGHSGFTDALQARTARQGIHLIHVDDLFAAAP